jgi:hypothetical protein
LQKEGAKSNEASDVPFEDLRYVQASEGSEGERDEWASVSFTPFEPIERTSEGAGGDAFLPFLPLRVELAKCGEGNGDEVLLVRVLPHALS